MVFGHYSATTARLVHIIPSFIQYKGHPFLSSPLYIFSLYYYTTYKRELWELLSSISLAFCNALAKLAIASVAVFILSVSFRAKRHTFLMFSLFTFYTPLFNITPLNPLKINLLLIKHFFNIDSCLFKLVFTYKRNIIIFHFVEIAILRLHFRKLFCKIR